YSLDQARYGEMRQGEAVLIFVTEPFLTDKEVKFESGDSSKSIPVLKLNLTKRFFTGIYPYTLMTSIFSPIDFQHVRTLKVTSTSLEWCGQTYMQLNFRNNQYDGTLHSYFQNEADQDFQIKTALLEDEVWTRIRLAPDELPKGDIDIVPGLQYCRLMHIKIGVQKAKATLTEKTPKSAGRPVSVYTIDYPDLKRKLQIEFEQQFPHAIVAWEETAPGKFSPDSPLLTTRAVRTNSIVLDYWNHNGNEDAVYRQKLGVTQR